MYSKRDIVIIKFPFSDLVNFKKRPVVVIAEKGEDILCCAITSNPHSEGVPITEFEEGSLPLKSKIKYWHINTILKEFVIKKVAKLKKTTHKSLLLKINEFIKE